jgi:NAD(P)-dependent dehydrogenase (short-subunit alcohol dehydrogenase family)
VNDTIVTAMSLAGKTCLVTGATSGIGEAVARRLAGLGARVVVVGRDPIRTAATCENIRRESGNGAVDLLIADLASQRAIRALAATFREHFDRLDVLVNNAGGINGERWLTEDGIETTWAVNHLACFLLTNLLREALEAGAPARVVTVSSDAHRRGRIDFDDPGGARDYTPWRAYAQSKLANILFTRELARRADPAVLTANALHPGVVGTRFGATSGPRWLGLGMRIVRPILTSPARAATTPVYLAASPEVARVTGRYFVRCRPVEPSAAARDDAAARRLWEMSAAMTATAS